MTTTIELPATVVTVPAPGNGAVDVSGALAAVDAAGSAPGPTLLNAGDWTSHFQGWTEVTAYGEGPELLNWTPPDGAVISAVDYVFRAYRESSYPDPGDATSVAAAAAFGSVPASLPAVIMQHATRGHSGYFPDLVVTTSWSDAITVTISDPDPATAAAGEPFNQFTAVQSETLEAIVKCDYLAVRITFEAPTPIRLHPRGDEAGIYSSPRIHPAGASNRIYGGQP